MVSETELFLGENGNAIKNLKNDARLEFYNFLLL
jgi:hypothetical protein